MSSMRDPCGVRDVLHPDCDAFHPEILPRGQLGKEYMGSLHYSS